MSCRIKGQETRSIISSNLVAVRDLIVHRYSRRWLFSRSRPEKSCSVQVVASPRNQKNAAATACVHHVCTELF